MDISITTGHITQDTFSLDIVQIAFVRNLITHSDEVIYADNNGPVSVGEDCLSKLTFQWQEEMVIKPTLISIEASLNHEKSHLNQKEYIEYQWEDIALIFFSLLPFKSWKIFWTSIERYCLSRLTFQWQNDTAMLST